MDRKTKYEVTVIRIEKHSSGKQMRKPKTDTGKQKNFVYNKDNFQIRIKRYSTAKDIQNYSTKNMGMIC